MKSGVSMSIWLSLGAKGKELTSSGKEATTCDLESPQVTGIAHNVLFRKHFGIILLNSHDTPMRLPLGIV